MAAVWGCAARPDSGLIASEATGEWEQLYPVASLPDYLLLLPTGEAQFAEARATWRMQDDLLHVRMGLTTRSFVFTRAGYVLMLQDAQSGDACFYISTQDFTTPSALREQFQGHWMAADGLTELSFTGADMYLTRTGADYEQYHMPWDAADGILRIHSGTYEYWLYAFESDGSALKIAASDTYDSDNRPWQYYWPRQPFAGYDGTWLLVDTDADDVAQTITFAGDQATLHTPMQETPCTVRQYGQGMLCFVPQHGELSATWVDLQQDSVLHLRFADDTYATYVQPERFLQAATGAADTLQGAWAAAEAHLYLTVDEHSTLQLAGQEEGTQYQAYIAGGVLGLRAGGQMLYVPYELVDEGSLCITLGEGFPPSLRGSYLFWRAQ